jgi:DNA helicase-2/ATP-dependent DNA helicase PcrA
MCNDDLDHEQRRAVDAEDAAIAVLAGPGSGKTRVLSYRARRLLVASPGSRALLLTFTNKAAAEMKARAMGVATVTSDRIEAGTFHAFGMSLLRSHGGLVGIGADFEILDREEQGDLAAEVARGVGVSARGARWSYLRLRREEIPDGSVAEFGAAYEEAKRRLGVVDFDDLVVYTANLLEEHRDVAEAYGTRFQHLLVDEFQDTNAAQFATVKAMCAHVETVSVFADDDQAIYRFVGAERENIRRFIAELGASEFPLTLNYRCRERVIEYANRLIRADPDASGRQMEPVYQGGEVRSLAFGYEEEEADTLAAEIEELIASGVPGEDIAVLARAAWRATPLLHALEAKGVRTANWLGDRYDPVERQTFSTIVSVVRGRFTERQAVKLCDLLDVEDTGERDVAAILEQQEGAPAVRDLSRLRDAAYAGGAASEIAHLARACGRTLRPEHDAALEAIALSVEEVEAHDPGFSLDDLLAELSLGGIGGAPTSIGGVKVASLHRTKGLQWPRVYIVGLENGTLPDYRAESPAAMSEERRACFVGVCRAESHLTLSRIREYRGFRKPPSIFLAEMGLDG